LAYRFLAARPSTRARKALLIALVALALVVAWAAAAFTQTGPGTLQWDMMRPDGRGRAPIVVQTGKNGKKYTYTYAKRTNTTATVARNGNPWVSIKRTSSGVEISDPNGTGQVVIKVSATTR
jgi:hypothetical protein